MANTLTALIPTIIAQAQTVLEEAASLPPLVNTDYAAEAAAPGSTITVPIAPVSTVTDVTPAATPPALPDTTFTSVEIALDQWKQTSGFHLTAKEEREIIDNPRFINPKIRQEIRALRNHIHSSIFGLYTGVYNAVGTAGTTPFASNPNLIAEAGKFLTDNLAPPDDRAVVIDTAAALNLRELSQFQKVNEMGSDSTLRSGTIGRLLGFDTHEDHAVPQHTAGTPGGTPLVNGAASAGATTVAVDGLTNTTGDYHAGDVITFAGHGQQYVVTALATANGSGQIAALAISPALQAGVADNAAVTLVATHRVNLAFHREAIALVTRQPILSTRDLGTHEVVGDSKSRLNFVLSYFPGFHAGQWRFSVLFGRRLVRPALAVRLLG